MVPWTKMHKSPLKRGHFKRQGSSFKNCQVDLRGKRPALPDFRGPIFCASMNRRNRKKHIGEVMTSKILIDEFQYTKNIFV